MSIKDKNDAQAFMYQFNIYAQVNKYSQGRGVDTSTTVKIHPHGHQLYSYYYQAGNYSDTIQVDTLEHLTWDHDNPPENHVNKYYRDLI